LEHSYDVIFTLTFLGFTKKNLNKMFVSNNKLNDDVPYLHKINLYIVPITTRTIEVLETLIFPQC